jgi:hypothetical protein
LISSPSIAVLKSRGDLVAALLALRLFQIQNTGLRVNPRGNLPAILPSVWILLTARKGEKFETLKGPGKYIMIEFLSMTSAQQFRKGKK